MSDASPDARELTLLRRQRHSFLNHLQVISGWLQLNQPERARKYLDGVAARMTGESEALRQASPNLALLMLDLGLEAETHGVALGWQVSHPQVDELMLEELQMEAMARLRAAAPDTEITIEVAANGFRIHSPSGQGKG